MATMVICCVRDAKLNEYANPMTFATIGVAERMFRDEVARVDDKNMLNKHPGDFALYAVATFYSETGHVEPFDPPLLILQADAVV